MAVPPIPDEEDSPAYMNELSQATESRSTLPLIAASLATVVALYLLVAATFQRSVVLIVPNPPAHEVLRNTLVDYASVVAVTGPASAFGLFIPALLALFPLATRNHRRGALFVAGTLTLGICLIWPLPIGVLYLPTALLLLLAAMPSSRIRQHVANAKPDEAVTGKHFS